MTSEEKTAAVKARAEKQTTFFVSQGDSIFFTDASFSTVRLEKDSLMVPPAAEDNGNGNGNGGGGGGSKPATVPKIAMNGRTIRTYRHSTHSDAESSPPIFSRAWFSSFAFLSSSAVPPPPPPAQVAASLLRPRRELPALPTNFARRRWWYAVMPTGYPHSVSQGFARFFVLNVVGCFLAAFSMTLATQSLLSSFFAGGTSVGWLVKDILPAFLTAYLAHQFITVERHPREWFIVANCLTQGAVCFDFAIPHIAAAVGNQVLVPLAAATSFVKGLAMLILTTSRTALVQSFSREGNLVELSKRLHGILVLVYPLASGVALCIPLFLPGLPGAAMACLVAAASVGCIGVSWTMVRKIYSKLLNSECAVENCRRHLRGVQLVKSSEAPSVALFARRRFHVPFRIGFSLSRAQLKARANGEILSFVSFNDSATQLNRCKYVFVFKRPVAPPALQQQQQQQQQSSPSSGSKKQKQVAAKNKQQQQHVQPQPPPQGEDGDLNPESFMGIVYDVNATFTDVIEAVLAALRFVEPRDELGALLLTPEAVGRGDTPPARVFLKKPPLSEVHSLVQQMHGAGWQTRAHQIDNRDYRVEILPGVEPAPVAAADVGKVDTVAAPAPNSSAAGDKLQKHKHHAEARRSSKRHKVSAADIARAAVSMKKGVGKLKKKAVASSVVVRRRTGKRKVARK